MRIEIWSLYSALMEKRKQKYRLFAVRVNRKIIW